MRRVGESAKGDRPNTHRRTALVAGLFYVFTFVSIPTLSLYSAVKSPGYVLGAVSG
jgi:hypothetical protein